MSRRLFRYARNVLPLLLLWVSLGCAQEGAAPQAPEVTVEKPVEKTVTDYLDVTGTVVAAERVEIRARVEGFLESIEFKEGDWVEKGALLYVIDPREYQERVASAKASLATAKASLALAEATLSRRERAFKTGAVSEVEVLDNRAKRDVSAAKLQSAEADLRRAKLDLSYTQIRAPVAGVMSDTNVDPGNLVGAGVHTLLATLVQYDPIYAYFAISEREVIRLMDVRRARERGEGRPVKIGRATDTDYPFTGKTDYIDSVVDENTGTFLVRGVFENPDPVQLLPGLFVRGRIPLRERKGALLVPERALGSDQVGRYLMVVDDKGIARHRSVKIGSLVDGMRVIEDGLKKDERVITNGVLYARPGAPVRASDVASGPSSAKSPGDG